VHRKLPSYGSSLMNYLITGKDYLEKFPDFKLIGREDDLNRLISILVRKNSNSVILTGARGVGCEHLCKGVQDFKYKTDAPFDILSKRLFWLDCNGLFASGNTAEINAEFQKIMRRLEKTSNSVLIIEDTRDFLESIRNLGCTHFINSLLSAVHRGLNQTILITGDDDLEYVLKAHNDFRELFTMMSIDEPTGDSLYSIVEDAANCLSKHHGIRISSEAIKSAIDLTNKYQTRDAGLNLAQPDKSITLIDRAFSSYRLESHRSPPPDISPVEWADYQKKLSELFGDQRDGENLIVSMEEQIDELREKGESVPNNLVKADDAYDRLTQIGGMDTEEIGNLKRKIVSYQKIVDDTQKEFKKITEFLNSKLELTKDVIVNEFSDISGISANKLNQNDREKLKNLATNIKKRIYGQDHAVDKLCDAIKASRLGKRTSGEPQSAFMFLGPSGVGKTEIAKALAANLFDDERLLVRFDMSEYMEKHAVARLIGAPPGYEGFESGGLLTNIVRKNNNIVLLFDEIEKAHPDIYNVFLQILSDGRLTDGLGRTANFEDCNIIMTTNIGQTHFLNPDLDFEHATELAMVELASTYRAEFLNRFDGRENIVCFNKLGVSDIVRVAQREISKLNAAYSDEGVSVNIPLPTMEEICTDIYDPKIGARGLPGYIKTRIKPIMANGLLDFPEFKGIYNVKYVEHKLEMVKQETEKAA
jgi:ATP-dependent Clp protease ATP-binding subunit ClpB